MGFRTGAYAKIWSVEKGNGNYYVADMSTSRKNADGDYEKDWGNKFVRLIAGAANVAETLEDGARVRIGDCEVTNYYDKSKQTLYTNYVIFSFMEDNDDNNGGESKGTDKKSNNKGSKKAKAKAKEEPVDDETFVNIPEGLDEELPFK